MLSLVGTDSCKQVIDRINSLQYIIICIQYLRKDVNLLRKDKFRLLKVTDRDKCMEVKEKKFLLSILIMLCSIYSITHLGDCYKSRVHREERYCLSM